MGFQMRMVYEFFLSSTVCFSGVLRDILPLSLFLYSCGNQHFASRRKSPKLFLQKTGVVCVSVCVCVCVCVYVCVCVWLDMFLCKDQLIPSKPY